MTMAIRISMVVVVSLVLLTLLPMSHAQTGQALIANPLLSQAKVKEVKRQIAEAAHKEAAPPSVAPPAPAPMMAAVPDHLLQQMRGGLPNVSGPASPDISKAAFSRLQVMAIVGKSAFIAMQTGGQDPSPMQGMPILIPGYGGGANYQGGTGTAQAPAAQQANQAPRRAMSILIRDRETVFIGGYDVIPTIRGDSVRLVLASAPNETVFQASIQPTLFSPPSLASAASLEKQSADYTNVVSPDPTSMAPAAAPNGGQVPAQLQGQQQLRPRLPLNGEGY